jgi:predicted dehydrogenase
MKLALAQVGCGGMGLRHVHGLIEAERYHVGRFELAAVCDRNESAARYVANVAEAGLGRRPAVYDDLEAMLRAETGIVAVNIVTDTRTHHGLAEAALAAGRHVAIEKPMAITVRAGLRIVGAAQKAGRVVSVLENFRRDPLVRLAKAAIDCGLIGTPRLLLDIALSGSRAVQQTAWRHSRVRGGWLLDSAIHDADLIAYLLGPITTVTAATALWEPTRSMQEGAMPSKGRADEISAFYRHRVREEEDRAEWIAATAEDSAFAIFAFQSGAFGLFAQSIATPGASMQRFVVHGAEGSIDLQGNRTGLPPLLVPSGRETPLAPADLHAALPNFQLDETTARVFGGDDLTGYSLGFAEYDRKLIAVELADFADAIAWGREPEINAEAGLSAMGCIYAVLEAGHARRSVALADVLNERVDAYQREINAGIGL